MDSLRTTASIILSNGDNILLMKRSASKKLSPGVWSTVGGHVESNEINNPQAACLREVFEETGIREQDISDYKMKYIIIRKDTEKIGVQYIFTGKTIVTQVTETVEGELYWIKESELLDREYNIVTYSVIKHYLQIGKFSDDLLVGVLGMQEGQANISWNILCNWNK